MKRILKDPAQTDCIILSGSEGSGQCMRGLVRCAADLLFCGRMLHAVQHDGDDGFF